MKLYIHEENLNDVFGMANLSPKETGLKVNIWSEHRGQQNGGESHSNTPRVKMWKGRDRISVSIEQHPRILAPSNCDLDRDFQKEVAKAFKDGMKYVGENYDLFLKHYMDTDEDEYTDSDLMLDLHARGYLKFSR